MATIKFYNRLLIASSGGFTLTELMAALVVMAIASGLAGSGLMQLLRLDQKSETITERRAALSRTLDFITEEVKRASKAEPVMVSGVARGVLLTIPNDSGALEKRLYYTCIGSCVGKWQGPTAMYRLSGDDLTTSTPLSGGNIMTDALTTPAAIPSCSGGTLVQGTGGGFYACLSGRTVDVHLSANLRDAHGGSAGVYSVSSRSVLRTR